MQLGQMRFEPNISLKIGEAADGTPLYTPITEIKNLNSFRSVERACDFEIRRHRDEFAADPEGYTLENLGKSTRGWNDDRGASFLQRSKEEAHDYRYFPEPDLVPFVPEPEWVQRIRESVQRIRESVPELPADRRRRFIDEYGLPASDAGVLTADRDVADFYEELARRVALLPHGQTAGPQYAKAASNWMMQDVMRVLNERRISITDLANEYGPMNRLHEHLSYLITECEAGAINRKSASQVFRTMLEEHEPPWQIIKEQGLSQMTKIGEISELVDSVIAENPSAAADYQSGKEKALGRLIGQAMKASGGKANPRAVRKLIIIKLRGG